MPTVLVRTAGLLTREQTATDPWAMAFGDPDAIPACDCCASGLTRRAVRHDGATYGVDCAVRLGIVRARDTKRPAGSPYVMTAANRRFIGQFSAAWDVALSQVLEGRWDASEIHAASPTGRAPTHTLQGLAHMVVAGL
jgi:hypothetical protein